MHGCEQLVAGGVRNQIMQLSVVQLVGSPAMCLPHLASECAHRFDLLCGGIHCREARKFRFDQ